MREVKVETPDEVMIQELLSRIEVMLKKIDRIERNLLEGFAELGKRLAILEDDLK